MSFTIIYRVFPWKWCCSGQKFFWCEKEINGKMIATHYILICDRGKRLPSMPVGLRSSSTAKVDCPFKVVAKTSKKSNGLWTYTVDSDGKHNHKPSLHPSAHAPHRKRTPIRKNLVEYLSKRREFRQGRSITLYVISVLWKIVSSLKCHL